MDGHPVLFQSIGEVGKRAARVKMRLARKEQGAAEPAGKIRLERGNARLVAPFMAIGALRKTRQFRRVARRCDDQAAVAYGAGEVPGPPVDRGLAEREHGG